MNLSDRLRRAYYQGVATRNNQTGDETMTDAKMDTRFFPGYTWVSSDPDCLLGLCMPSTDRSEAATMFLRSHNTYHNRGRTFSVYTMSDPGDTPTRVEITL